MVARKELYVPTSTGLYTRQVQITNPACHGVLFLDWLLLSKKPRQGIVQFGVQSELAFVYTHTYICL